MGLDSVWHGLSLTLQVSLIDLLLSGDNAIVIALACRRLPAAQMRQAILIGTAVAIGLRILFTGVVTLLLGLSGLKLLGMAALIVIAIKLLVEEQVETSAGADDGLTAAPATALWSAVGVIIVADVAMSLDNVVALAAVAQGSLVFLLLGLGLSVPLLMYGSLLVSRLLQRFPVLVPAGAALLGWVAGDIGVSDPWIADWVATQAPSLGVTVPLACAIFVLMESRIIQRNLPRFPRPGAQVAGPSVHRTAAIESPSRPVQRVEPLPQTVKPVSARPFAFTRAGLPYLLVPLFAVPVLAVIGSIAYQALTNDSLMPKPRSLIRYECPGSNGTYSFYFRHGSNNVQIRSNAGTLQGRVRDRKIDWANFSGGTALLGFSPPTEITYDDGKSIRVNGGSSLQVDCPSTEPTAPRR